MSDRRLKILFYVEPHGVRDSFTAHSLPFDYFRRMVAELQRSDSESGDGVEARIFCNHFLGDQKLESFYSIWPFILQPTPAERDAIEDMAALWMFEGMNDWIALMRDPLSPHALQYASILRRIKTTEFDFDVIVSWGDNAAVRAIGEEFGIRTVYMELASMRPPFPRAVLMDPVGANGSASTVAWDVSVLDDVLTPLPQVLVPTFLNEELNPGQQSSAIPQARFGTVSTPLRNFIKGRRPIALVPLQIADDANQLLYSNYDSVDSFVTSTVEPLLAADFDVILKAHPHAELRGGYVMNAQRQALRRYADNPRVLLLEANAPASDYLPLLGLADLVVTNNSSVGFEAMILGRRVVVLGRACYAPVNALPPLDVAIDCLRDRDLDALWRRRSLVTVTYMLACAFPLSRRLGRELVTRADLWTRLPPVQENTKAWLSAMIEETAWTTWSQRDFLRDLIRPEPAAVHVKGKWGRVLAL